ncbi:MAG: nucleotide exchange factor GrpE [Candidatus Methanosuratus sp.]|nr:nucleotide exchange factor GrpE [Candidatus Methanosuratincola sp.]
MRAEGSGGNLQAEGITEGITEGKVPEVAEEEQSPELQHLQDEICRYKEKLDALSKELADSKNRLKYVLADCENIRKRTEKLMEETKLHANIPLICDLLEVVDELELALKSASDQDRQGAFVQGVEMTLRKLKKVLEKHGVSQIECLMKPLDPEKHMVVSKEERDDLEENTVIDEIRKGYLLRERVIRPSIVKVSVKPSGLTKSMEEK